MKITQGQIKGLQLPYIKGSHRPFMAKAREWLFHHLADIEGKRFLDLFAGTAVMALEAFSAGAIPTAVERDVKTVVQVRKILEKRGIRFPYLAKPVESFIKQQKQSFDIVFLDPPFAYAHKSDLLSRLFHSPIIAPSSRVIVHSPKNEGLLLPEFVHVSKEQFFGFSHVQILVPQKPD